MSTWVINSGYESVKLVDTEERLVHRLVAKAFCEGYKPGLTVNHIDANRLNNHHSNLEWVTYTENVQDVFKRGKGDVTTAQNKVNLKKGVTQMDMEGNTINHWESTAEITKELGYSNSHISRACNNKVDVAYGYKWKFTNPEAHQSVSRNHHITRVDSEGKETEYPSMLQAAKSIGVNSSTLARYFKIHGDEVEYKGYKWKRK